MTRRKSILTYSFDFGAAFITCWSQVFLKAIFTIEFSLLLYKANVCQWTTALGIHTYKMIWAPVLAQCSDEWASVTDHLNYCRSVIVHIVHNTAVFHK
jgi:hypothetical protein